MGLLGLGILRRLDDASFWRSMACLFAAAKLLAVLRRWLVLGPSKDGSTTSEISRRSNMMWLMWLFLGVWIVAYTWGVCRAGGTIAWPVHHWEPKLASYWIIAIIQIVEYFINIGSEFALVYASIQAYAIVCPLRKSVLTPVERKIAGDLLTACISPFPMIFFIVAVYKTIASDIGFIQEGSLLFGMKMVGNLGFASIPLVIVFIFSAHEWSGRHYQFHLSKNLISIEVEEEFHRYPEV